MADPALCERIVEALKWIGGPVTARNPAELREKLGISWSNTQFKRALGSLIDRGVVLRSRPNPEGPGDSYQPVTIRLRTS